MFTNEAGKIYTTAKEGDTIPLRLTDIDNDTELRQCVKKTVGTIAWMLRDRAEVEDGAIAKKQRVEANLGHTHVN